MAKRNKQRTSRYKTEVAKKAAELRRQQEAADRRRRTLLTTVAVAAVVVGVVVVGVAVQYGRSPGNVTASGQNGVEGATDDYGFLVGQSSAPAKLIAYEDFACPHCAHFERVNGDLISAYIEAGKLKVEYRPVAFLSDYSTSALNAAACVFEESGDQVFKKYHDLLFATQPSEGVSLSDEKLVDLAVTAGSTKREVSQCIKGGAHTDWATAATKAAQKSPAMSQGLSVPTVLLDRKRMDSAVLYNRSAMRTALKNAIE